MHIVSLNSSSSRKKDMNMSIARLFNLFLSLYLLCLGVHCYSHEKKLIKKVLNLNDIRYWKKQPVSSPTRIPKKSGINNGKAILEMQHRGSENIKSVEHWNEHLKFQLIQDDLRVKSIHQLSKSNGQYSDSKRPSNNKTRIPLISGINLQILNYIVTVQLGGRNVTIIVDTGSDLTWVQCQPCRSCYEQNDPLFDPTHSKTYRPIPCETRACQEARGICASRTCRYDVGYGDGSRTRGDLGMETLGMGVAPRAMVEDFVFGCGRANKGLFGGASGVMGLGRSGLSLVAQSESVFGGVFSYCLPPARAGALGSLIMGFDSLAYANSTPISYTPMISNPQLPTFYFLNLTEISVGDVHVPTTVSAFSILIDSGTVITRLAPSMYKAVKAEFVKQFSGFPQAPGFSILDTCFNLSGYEEVIVPAMRMTFEGGAELAIDVTGMLYMVRNDASQVCLALASLSYEYEIGIIGNYQQKNQRVVYDTKLARLGFAGETCTSS